MPKHIPLTYRAAEENDYNFVLSTWLKSYRQNNESARHIKPQIYFANHKRFIDRILDDSQCIIACNPEEPTQIFGYGVFEEAADQVALVHCIYVKLTYRRLGIGTDLLYTMLGAAQHDHALPVVISHLPDRSLPRGGEERPSSFWEILQPKWNLVYNPYLSGARYDAIA